MGNDFIARRIPRNHVSLEALEKVVNCAWLRQKTQAVRRIRGDKMLMIRQFRALSVMVAGLVLAACPRAVLAQCELVKLIAGDAAIDD